jgi:hypothetical protein
VIGCYNPRAQCHSPARRRSINPTR